MADVTDATFETDVIARSREVAVVVDLWADWCGPCRQLGPILEKVIGETDGRVELAKVDVDANPGISGSFRVQSIPAVYALKDGAVVDGFVGAQPEAAVQAFVDRLLPSDEERELARLVDAGDEDSLNKALELQPGFEPAVLGLAELLVGEGRPDEALALLERIPETAETRRIAALARTGATPDAAVSDDVNEQLAALLDDVKDDEDARRRFVDLLEVMGPSDPRTAEWRKKLTARLF